MEQTEPKMRMINDPQMGPVGHGTGFTYKVLEDNSAIASQMQLKNIYKDRYQKS